MIPIPPAQSEFFLSLSQSAIFISSFPTILELSDMKSTRRKTDRGLRGSDESHDPAVVSSVSNNSIDVDTVETLWIANFCLSRAEPPSVEAWLAKRDPFPPVGIEHSRPFPLMRFPFIREFAYFYEAHVESQVRPILEKHHINIAAINLSRRGGSNKPLTEIDYPHTLLVKARDDSLLKKRQDWRQREAQRQPAEHKISLTSSITGIFEAFHLAFSPPIFLAKTSPKSRQSTKAGHLAMFRHTESRREDYSDTWTSAAQEIQEAHRHAGIPNEEIEG